MNETNGSKLRNSCRRAQKFANLPRLENGELRIIVRLPDELFETRYIAHFEGEDVKLEHRP